MNLNRKQFELAILNQFFKNRYAFMTEGRNEWFEVGLKSNQGNVYKITISIPLNYPYELPETAITFPTELRGFKRSKIKSFCHEMHTLSCSKSSLGLCLFHPSQWHPINRFTRLSSKLNCGLKLTKTILKQVKTSIHI